VVVRQHCVPGVLVDEQAALAIQVPAAFLDVGLDHPDPPQLVTQELGVGMVDGQQVRVADVLAVHLVGVGRNDDLLLAHQGPVVAIRRTVEQAVLIDGHQAVTAAQRLVVAIAWGQAYPPRPGVIGPGGTRRGAVVIGLMVHREVAALTQWQQYLGGAVGRDAVIGMRTQARIRIHGRRQAATMGTAPTNAATGSYRCDIANLILGPGAERQLMVPEHFHGALRNREGNVAQAGVTEAIIDDLGIFRVPPGALARHLGVGKFAPTFIDVDLVGVGITLEHRLLAFSQLVGMLGHVGGSDDQDRLVIGKGVDRMGAAVRRRIPAGHLAHMGALELGDAAIGVGGTFSADTGQVLAQARCLLRGYGSSGQPSKTHADGGGQGNYYTMSTHYSSPQVYAIHYYPAGKRLIV